MHLIDKTLIFLLGLCLGGLILLNLKQSDLSPSKQKAKVIDIPEEISVCSVGDTLRIERITADSIFVVFANKRNN